MISAEKWANSVSVRKGVHVFPFYRSFVAARRVAQTFLDAYEGPGQASLRVGFEARVDFGYQPVLRIGKKFEGKLIVDEEDRSIVGVLFSGTVPAVRPTGVAGSDRWILKLDGSTEETSAQVSTQEL